MPAQSYSSGAPTGPSSSPVTPASSSAAQAGVRETEEEAGVTGELLGSVGAPLEYDWAGKRYRVQYFLIRATAEAPASDGRAIAWLPFDEALQRLSFDDTGRLLREARPRMEGALRA